MSEFRCPFCGSEEQYKKTPYMKPAKGKLGYEQDKQPCCRSQAANLKYVKNRFDPLQDSKPKLEEVSKW